MRLFKTRALATTAVKSGKIKLNGEITKPAKELKIGDEISFKVPPITRTIQVKGFPTSRVGAKLVTEFFYDLTPAEEYEKIRLMKELGPPVFLTQKGRPTKKDRRSMEGFF